MRARLAARLPTVAGAALGLVLLGLVLVDLALGLAPAMADQAAAVKAARAAVAAVLKDPASARFEAVAARPGAVCGFVNARNGAGGYGGRMLFVYVEAERRAYVLDPASTAGPAWAARAAGAYSRLCR